MGLPTHRLYEELNKFTSDKSDTGSSLHLDI